jgi:tRNA1(Val) A37 N6-methylase TrmN6
MKIAPQRLVFGEAEFNKLVEQAIKDDVLTYNPPYFYVNSIDWNADAQEYTVELEATEPPAPKEKTGG